MNGNVVVSELLFKEEMMQFSLNIIYDIYIERERDLDIEKNIYNHILSLSTLGLVPYKGELLIVRSSLVEVDQVFTTLNAW